jgi:hypothetical protein
MTCRNSILTGFDLNKRSVHSGNANLFFGRMRAVLVQALSRFFVVSGYSSAGKL